MAIPTERLWRPGEADVSIRPGWFWHEAEDAKVKSPSQLLELFVSSVGRNAGLLLNVPPNRAGLLSDADVSSLKTFGDTRSAWFSRNLAASAFVRHEPSHVVLTLAKTVAFDTIVMCEEIERGQMVEGFTVETDDGNRWKPLASGTTIGAKRMVRVNSVTAARVRVSMQSSLGRPSLTDIALHQSGS